MRTGVDYLKARAAERGVTLPENESWPAELFAELGLPMVVQCCECTSTMAFPSALVDDDGHTHCSDCAPDLTDARNVTLTNDELTDLIACVQYAFDEGVALPFRLASDEPKLVKQREDLLAKLKEAQGNGNG